MRIPGRLVLSGLWFCAAVGVVALFAWHRANWPVLLLTDPHLGYVVEFVVIAVFIGFGWREWRRKNDAQSLSSWAVFLCAMSIWAAPYARHAYFKNKLRPTPHRAEAIEGVRKLRVIIADQEDHLLAHGAYADQAGLLGVDVRAEEHLVLRADGGRGWSARLELPGYVCRVRVRNGAADFADLAAADGIPMCRQAGDSAGREYSFPVQQDVRQDIVPTSYAKRRTSTPRSTGGEWLQYRHDGAKTGTCCAGSAAYRWRVSVGSQLRATPLIVGDFLIVGAHGSGELVALDRRDGALVWRTRVPNWVHNDAVAKNGIVLVGFGTHGAGTGFPPGGVAAFDLASGRRMWTRYAGGVMTSPAVSDSAVVFSGMDNSPSAVELSTGKPIWTSSVPGPGTMANPLIVGLTLYVAAGQRALCAIDVQTGRRQWCHEFVGYAYVDESSASGSDSIIVQSAIQDSTVEARLLGGDFQSVFRDLRMMLTQARPSHLGGHVVMGISRRDGSVVWTQDLGGGFDRSGHVGGTATVVGQIGYVVSPVSRTITAIETQTGRRLWQRTLAGTSRGPPTVLGERVLVVLRSGAFEVYSANAGASQCAGSLGYPVDRAGVTVSGATAYITSLIGYVEAVPVAELLDCKRRAAQTR